MVGFRYVILVDILVILHLLPADLRRSEVAAPRRIVDRLLNFAVLINRRLGSVNLRRTD